MKKTLRIFNCHTQIIKKMTHATIMNTSFSGDEIEIRFVRSDASPDITLKVIIHPFTPIIGYAFCKMNHVTM